jgi:hypothetical protein
MSNNNRQRQNNKPDSNTPPVAVEAEPITAVQPEAADEQEQEQGGVRDSLNPDNLPAIAWLPFVGKPIFAPTKNARVFVDEKSGISSRSMLSGAVALGSTKLYVKFNIGVRWGRGAKKVTPYLSLPTLGGRFQSGLDTDDIATSDALEAWKRETIAAGMAYLKDRAKSNPTAPGTRTTVTEPETVDADVLGLSID